MPLNVLVSTSRNTDSKIDTSLFIQKPYLRTNYIENKSEGKIDVKN